MEPFPASKSLNPWRFQLNKLKHELQCPICLDLLQRPLLLPCDHFFCDSCVSRSVQTDSQCPFCLQKYHDSEIRPSPYMEKIVSIYKGLDSFVTNIQSGSSDVLRASEQCPVMTQKGNVQTAHEGSSNISINANKHSNHCIELTEKMLKCNPGIVYDGKFDTGSGSGQMDFNAENEHIDLSNRVKQSSPMKDPPSLNVQKSAGKRSFQNNSNSGGNEDLNKCTATGATSKSKTGKRQKTLRRLSNLLKQSLNESKTPKSNSKANVGQPSIISDSLDASKSDCAFCHSYTITDENPMLHFRNGLEVNSDAETTSKIIHVHKKCVDWAPRVHYRGEKRVNLESEINRAAKLKCAFCGKKGAALGCFLESCRKSFHAHCALECDCKLETERFLALCPAHKAFDFPKEDKESSQKNSAEMKIQSSPFEAKEWSFCGSGLSIQEKFDLAKFAEKYKASVYVDFTPNLTHLIVLTNEKGVYKRTSKVLLAILSGKWILSMDWVRDCMKANKLLDEEPYEVSLDNYGSCNGPISGRLRASKNAQKLFGGFSFICSNGFESSTKTELIDFIKLGGGNVIESRGKLVSSDSDVDTSKIVVYNGNPCEDTPVILAKAKNLANENGCMFVKHTWILDSIAACKLQPLPLFQN